MCIRDSSKLDGISVDYDDWHFNVRMSNTEPLLRLNLESVTSRADMERRRDEVLDTAAVLAERTFEHGERGGGVRPCVDERERVVLYEVRVHAPDGERRRYGQAVDAGRLGGRPLAHERIRPRTSSRRRSMSSRETSDSRFRRSSGSVLEGRTLKCQSG